MIATRKTLVKQAAEIDIAASIAEAPKSDGPIKSKKPRLRGRARAQVAAVINAPSSPAATKVAPGTKIVKVHKGRRHVVTAIEKGFEWSGKHFRSLSSVAKAISGSHCSGPAFFGLKTRAKKKVKP